MNLLRRFLREHRRGLVGWSLGLAAVCFVYLPIYPSMAGPELSRLMEQLPEALLVAMGMTGPLDGAGYTHASVFGLVGTLLMIMAAVSWGTRAVAGDEESGAMELTLAHPVTRTELVWQRAVGVALLTGALALAVTLSLLVLSRPSQLGLVTTNVLATGAAFWGLGLLHGWVALAAGALTGRRSVALGAAGGLAVAGYLADAVGSQRVGLGWLGRLSPFDWAYGSEPLRHGLDASGLLLLGAVALLALVVAVWAFSRRDVGAG
ncbi:MAG: ABC transporter permease subunit [Deinococcales bacterium]|nr:ABC transporter permease subunit [Deinococcales bacterium]